MSCELLAIDYRRASQGKSCDCYPEARRVALIWQKHFRNKGLGTSDNADARFLGWRACRVPMFGISLCFQPGGSNITY